MAALSASACLGDAAPDDTDRAGDAPAEPTVIEVADSGRVRLTGAASAATLDRGTIRQRFAVAGAAPSVRDSSGVAVVENPAEGALGPLDVRETLRLGSVDAESPELFAWVEAVATDGQGAIYIANGGSTSVRVFERDGTFLREFGRQGEGPAEVGKASGLVVTDRTVALISFQEGGKVVLFTPEGEFIASRSPLYRPDGHTLTLVAAAADGWIWQTGDPYRPRAPGSVVEGMTSIRLLPFDWTQPDVGSPTYHFAYGRTYVRAVQDGGSTAGLYPQRPFYGFDGRGRLYLTSPDSYAIRVLGPDGPVRTIRRDFELHRITEDDIEALKDASAGRVDSMALRSEGPARLRARMSDEIDRDAELPVPEVLTPFRQIQVSPDGSFWAEVRNPEYAALEEAERPWWDGIPPRESVWDIFDVDGVYLGQVTLPPRFRVESVDRLEVVGVHFDEYDVEFVVRYDVVRGGAG